MSYKNQLIKHKQHEVQDSSYSLAEIVNELKRIFKYAVGREEGLTMEQIYEEVYGRVDSNPYLRMFKIQLIQVGINFLKKRTNFFIISDTKDKERVWYVVHNLNEAQSYCNECDKKIGGFKYMKKRCVDVVQRKLYLKLK
jgi:hypothetical protein